MEIFKDLTNNFFKGFNSVENVIIMKINFINKDKILVLKLRKEENFC